MQGNICREQNCSGEMTPALAVQFNTVMLVIFMETTTVKQNLAHCDQTFHRNHCWWGRRGHSVLWIHTFCLLPRGTGVGQGQAGLQAWKEDWGRCRCNDPSLWCYPMPRVGCGLCSCESYCALFWSSRPRPFSCLLQNSFSELMLMMKCHSTEVANKGTCLDLWMGHAPSPSAQCVLDYTHHLPPKTVLLLHSLAPWLLGC